MSRFGRRFGRLGCGWLFRGRQWEAQVQEWAAQLGWNAVATKVNARGQVEDTCVGTGMAFDPAYYYHRPKSPYAQHGYGPVLLAGAEMITFFTLPRTCFFASVASVNRPVDSITT